MFIVVLLMPRDQSHFLPAYVSSHVDQSGIRWVHKQIQAAPGFEPGASARQSATLSTAPPVDYLSSTQTMTFLVINMTSLSTYPAHKQWPLLEGTWVGWTLCSPSCCGTKPPPGTFVNIFFQIINDKKKKNNNLLFYKKKFIYTFLFIYYLFQ